MSLKPCIVCGEPSDETRCSDHRIDHALAKDERRGSARARGYGSAWDRLSRKARKLQPFCLDAHLSPCSGPLTTDHKPEAWQRVAEGKPLRLSDVEVVCDGHNAARGSSRPGSERARAALTSGGVDPLESVYGPPGQAQNPLHTPQGYAAEGVTP